MLPLKTNTGDQLLVDSAEAVRPCGMARSAEEPLVHRIGPAEALMTLTEAARRLPRIDGKKVSVCTLWRWFRKGMRGEHLQYARIGRKVCTSPEALQRFFTKLVELDERVTPDTRSLPPAPSRPGNVSVLWPKRMNATPRSRRPASC